MNSNRPPRRPVPVYVEQIDPWHDDGSWARAKPEPRPALSARVLGSFLALVGAVCKWLPL